MKTTLIHSSIAFVALSLTVNGATTFSSDLTSLPPGLAIADAAGTDNAVTFSASGATFSTVVTGNDSRNYIRTTDTDYITGSYTAEVTWNGLGSAFIGFGGGNVGTFGTPDWDVADSLWLELAGASDSGPVQGTNTGRFSSNIASFNNAVIGGNAAQPVRLRMTYLSGANTLQFFADNNYNGTFSADALTPALKLDEVGGGANFFTQPGDQSRFFFGGGTFGTASPTYSDYSVVAVPEPSAAALLGLGALGLLVRRRK